MLHRLTSLATLIAAFGSIVEAQEARKARREITAVRAATAPTIDGALDDEVWRSATPSAEFVQAEPSDGAPATEPTEVWVAYDTDNLYVAAFCHDGALGGGVLNDIRKDFNNADQDTFEVILDTFADRRNGFVFMTNRAGARADQQVANEGRETNASWDAVWFVKTKGSSAGWTLEISIPFKSLRFDPAARGVWGVNFLRRLRKKNELDYWSPVPRAYTLARVSLAGDLLGLDGVEPGRNLRIKPYALAQTLRPTGGRVFAQQADGGVDLKYGLTPSLTLDVAANPDFAQVEADVQQANFTQFSLFYPEKRDFFLENSGIFHVGDTARNNRLNPTPTPDEDMLLFFSRRIGLTSDGREIPILAGGRITGQAGGFGLGALVMRTREADPGGAGLIPANTYAVARLRRNVFGHSDVGALVMSRDSSAPNDFNRVYGVDSTFRLGSNLDWNTYAVKTRTPGKIGKDHAFRTSLNREGRFFHGKGGVLSIGENFNDDLGYFRRVGVRKWFFDVGVRPRPKGLQDRGIREMHPHAVWDYYEDQGGHRVAKSLHNGYTFFLQNGGYTELSVNNKFELIDRPFIIRSGSGPIAAGQYGWTEYQLRGQTDPSRKLTVDFVAIAGGLWNGTQRTFNVTATMRPSQRFQMDLGLSRTLARLARPTGRFVTQLWTLRSTYSFNTNMFLAALVQYDRDQRVFNSNVRFNFIHRPLSDLFVVFNEQRVSTPADPLPGRSLAVKFTRSLSF